MCVRLSPPSASRCPNCERKLGPMEEYKDRILKGVECGADFVFTAGEHLFFAEKNFKNDPKRCKSCKGNRNQRTREGHSPRAETTTSCSQCGRETTVPFRPTQG